MTTPETASPVSRALQDFYWSLCRGVTDKAGVDSTHIIHPSNGPALWEHQVESCTGWKKLLTSPSDARVKKSSMLPRKCQQALRAEKMNSTQQLTVMPHSFLHFLWQSLLEVTSSIMSVSTSLAAGRSFGPTAFPTVTFPPPDQNTVLSVFLGNPFNTL